MDVARRIKLSRIVEKVQRNKIYANKIGTADKSEFRTNEITKDGGAKK